MHPTVQKLLAYFGIDSAGDGQRSMVVEGQSQEAGVVQADRMAT